MKKIQLTILVGLVGIFLGTATFALECTAKIANRTYQVKLMDKAGVPYLEVANDAGSTYQGFVTKFYSAYYRTDTYHLPVTNRVGALELEVERKDNARVAFCLDQSTCTYCQ